MFGPTMELDRLDMMRSFTRHFKHRANYAEEDIYIFRMAHVSLEISFNILGVRQLPGR